MENLQQIIVQIETAPFVRSLAQYGSEIMPTEQKEIIYSELSDSEKDIFDSFVEMIKTK